MLIDLIICLFDNTLCLKKTSHCWGEAADFNPASFWHSSIHESISEKIIKIGRHFVKLSQKIKVGRFFETQCSTSKLHFDVVSQ